MKKRNMKVLALLMTVTMAGTMLAGCGRSDGKEDEKEKIQAKSEGKVYYLNFKPEQADDWVKLAETYTDETGVQVDVQTAASGTYESQLKSEMAKEDGVLCLGEIMNYKDLSAEGESRTRQMIAACKNAGRNLRIEGHCPGLTRRGLKQVYL